MVTGSQAALRRERILTAAIRQRLIDPDDALLAGFVDLDGVADSVAALQQAFRGSVSVLHAFAAKANPLVPLLKELRGLGMGCEVASAGELAQALAAGFAPEQIVFDSPAKTRAELRQALELGVAVNADNFQELDRIGDLLATCSSTSRIGIRINPQVGAGSIAASSTATATSKFGIALEDDGNMQRLLRAYREHPWLTWVHAHVGSQGCPLDLIAEGIAKTVAFADKVNAEIGRRQITGIDIGGGLPVDFDTDDTTPGFDTYVAHLRDHAPALFTGAYRIVTEFGHSLLSKNGFTAAYVEYTKTSGGRPIAITHAGAQVATRTVFQPDSWPLRVAAHHPTGARKTGPLVAQDIAGPLCFAGDVIARARRLPALVPGDVVTILDTGAYCFSAPYHFNTLPEPAVYGVRTGPRGDVRFELLRPAQTIDDLVTRASH
ncbi:diaminopimelate decarboxylase [Streptomyces viridochromogenes]|uniref:diaminopimelate decarboxylase n=1 Tax=Streptomyces viridochromogenes TaxID=1938 RepID=UPI00069EFE4B|nr:diaminopimelate decarboxylase [Streptomyces viridochromogenes]KOG07502.1 diaminopimelate decarboxylase [Streptomyces viridochromogenes]KOG12643.1 diaminopimelate decarboxylase [Streptomyces viridochromogenes]